MKKPRVTIEPRVKIKGSRPVSEQSSLSDWLNLFWIFLKVNLLTTAGATSVGLLYKETVGVIMTEAQFVEAVGFSNLVPGSEALKLAMFIGYASGGIAGLLAALLGAIIPPTAIMLTVASILIRFQGQDWMKFFIKGMTPAISVLMGFVAWQLFRANNPKLTKWRPAIIALFSAMALWFNVPPQYVLIGAGFFGILLFR